MAYEKENLKNLKTQYLSSVFSFKSYKYLETNKQPLDESRLWNLGSPSGFNSG